MATLGEMTSQKEEGNPVWKRVGRLKAKVTRERRHSFADKLEMTGYPENN
jgi:hypothetical protein